MRCEFSRTTKALAFQRANGKCEGENCGARLTVGKYEYDHENPDGLTGDNSLGNCVVLCLACHRDKTRADVANIARAKRVQARHIGAKRAAYRPIQSAPFQKREKRARPLTKIVPRRDLFTREVTQ